ncbi:MAG: DUF202 domain-containing protein [Lachnospiraceae bacterium]|nr:DUF202 domain-containing protein [Lachnospiraceae bacterium]
MTDKSSIDVDIADYEIRNLEQELAQERTILSHERTDLSILRTTLAFKNSKLSVEQTHLSFVRTTVSLIGSAAAVYKALPALGVSGSFSTALSGFLLLAGLYFLVLDLLTYPRRKRELDKMEEKMDEIINSSVGSEE